MRPWLLAVVIVVVVVASLVVGYRLVQWGLYDSWERACVRSWVNHAARIVFVDAQFEDGSTVRIQYCIDDHDDYVNHRELP